MALAFTILIHPLVIKVQKFGCLCFLVYMSKFWQSTNTGWNWWLLGWSGVVHFPLIKKLGRTFITGQWLVSVIRFILVLVTAKCLVCHDDLLNYVLVHSSPPFFSLYMAQVVVEPIVWFCWLKLLFDITLVSYHLFYFIFC